MILESILSCTLAFTISDSVDDRWAMAFVTASKMWNRAGWDIRISPDGFPVESGPMPESWGAYAEFFPQRIVVKNNLSWITNKELAKVAAHEIGHHLGYYNESYDPTNIMYYMPAQTGVVSFPTCPINVENSEKM